MLIVLPWEKIAKFSILKYVDIIRINHLNDDDFRMMWAYEQAVFDVSIDCWLMFSASNIDMLVKV